MDKKIIGDEQFDSIDPAIEKLQQNFNILNTQPLSFRKEQLKALKRGMIAKEAELLEAMHTDLGTDVSISYQLTVQGTNTTIDDVLSNIDKYASDRAVPAFAGCWPAKCYVRPQGKGVYCIFGAWNAPILVTFKPLVYAIASGNCVLVKPSEYSPSTSKVMYDVIKEYLDPRFYDCIEGGVKTAIKLSNTKFDGIVFTGGTVTGKIIASCAGKNLVPCILELGGKCPVVIDDTANCDLAAKRIANWKFINTGQICVSADYLLVHEAVYEQFKEKFIYYCKKYFKADAKDSKIYGRMIHRAHCERTWNLLKGHEDKIIYRGGKPDFDNLFLPPTIIEDPPMDSELMNEEIFGPIISIKKFSQKQEVIDIINARGRPLVIYYFGNTNSEMNQDLLNKTRSGSYAANECGFNLINSALPFGGTGDSGYGCLNTQYCFDQMSVLKAVTERPNSSFMDLPQRYPSDTMTPEQKMNELKQTGFVFKIGDPSDWLRMFGKIAVLMFVILLFWYDVVKVSVSSPALGF